MTLVRSSLEKGGAGPWAPPTHSCPGVWAVREHGRMTHEDKNEVLSSPQRWETFLPRKGRRKPPKKYNSTDM